MKKKSALNNTPTNHPTSQGKGQPCASEKTRATTTPTPRTPVLAAGMAELISGDVPAVLTGATETQRPPDTLKSTPPLAMAGNQDALQLSGATSMYVVSKEGGAGETDQQPFHTLQDHSSPTPTPKV